MKKHAIRRVAAAAMIATGAIGAAVAPAGATTFVDSAYADTKSTCAIPGLVAYSGAGFTHARFSTWVDGVGWMVGNWQHFRRNWDESAAFTVAPVPQRGKRFAVYAEYAYFSAGDNQFRFAREWAPMDGNGYWCTMR